MIRANQIKAVLTLAAVATVLLALPATADIPDPLPDPDTTPPDATKPVKVYILSGQSNMVGMGNINGTQPGTLETIAKRENKFPNLVDDAGAWTVRNDVMYRGVITAIGDGPLTPGVQGGTIGPDMGFGHVMGYYHDEPVIVLKTSQGNRSIGWDCLPPGSDRYIYGDHTYAGYGDSPNRWLTEGGGPSPFNWYAGKQYDDYFLDESDMGPTDWADATYYFRDKIQVRHNGVVYISKSEHTSSAASEPGVGPQSSTYWNVYSVFNVTDILDNFASEYPEYAAQGFEIAGFGWWQGHKDQYDASYADRYEFNLENFINEVRAYYENRYPGKIRPKAPFVVATIGFGGAPYTPGTAYYKIYTAQMSISDPVKHPDFAGNVASVDTLGYWREAAESPVNQGYHYNRNAETFILVGDAMGRAMADLLTPYSVDAGDDVITWSGRPVELDATVQEGVTVTSYAWSAEPNEGVVFSDETIEDPDVTITKPAFALTAVTIANPGFEVPVLTDGDWTSTPPAWTDGHYNVTAPTVWVVGDSDAGVYNPTAAAGYGGVAPEGDNVMYATSGAGYDKGMSQVLSANLQANTQYDLSALVGNPFLFNGSTAPGDYRIEMLAGGVVLASDAGPPPADDTTWKTASLTYDSGADPAQLGEALEIRLLAVNFANGKGVDFDNVQLTAEGPPAEPHSVRLTLTVNDGENPPVRNAMTIDVYDDACKAAIGKGLGADNPGDFDGDCITSFTDLAVMATKWLNDTGLTGPVPKP